MSGWIKDYLSMRWNLGAESGKDMKKRHKEKFKKVKGKEKDGGTK